MTLELQFTIVKMFIRSATAVTKTSNLPRVPKLQLRAIAKHEFIFRFGPPHSGKVHGSEPLPSRQLASDVD